MSTPIEHLIALANYGLSLEGLQEGVPRSTFGVTVEVVRVHPDRCHAEPAKCLELGSP